MSFQRSTAEQDRSSGHSETIANDTPRTRLVDEALADGEGVSLRVRIPNGPKFVHARWLYTWDAPEPDFGLGDPLVGQQGAVGTIRSPQGVFVVVYSGRNENSDGHAMVIQSLTVVSNDESTNPW